MDYTVVVKSHLQLYIIIELHAAPRRRQCGPARFWRAGSRPQRGSGGRRGGSQLKRRICNFEKTRTVHESVMQHC